MECSRKINDGDHLSNKLMLQFYGYTNFFNWRIYTTSKHSHKTEKNTCERIIENMEKRRKRLPLCNVKWNYDKVVQLLFASNSLLHISKCLFLPFSLISAMNNYNVDKK